MAATSPATTSTTVALPAAYSGTVFGQLFRQLRYLPPSALRNSERAFYTEFAGEHADDYGGPYREALALLADELMADGQLLPLFMVRAVCHLLDAIVIDYFMSLRTSVAPLTFAPAFLLLVRSSTLIAFVRVSWPVCVCVRLCVHGGALQPCPNARQSQGQNKDRFVPSPLPLHGNPLSLVVCQFEFLGVLFGVAVRTGCPMDLALPSLVWKPLVGDVVTPSDVEAVHEAHRGAMARVRELVRHAFAIFARAVSFNV